ncbi:MAG: FTR1 family protein [Chitinophagales bacterium]|nr:FTR1 family protein [Chitinophagales bacterium]
MLESFIILFRESFEAALITGIVLSYLNRKGAQEQIRTVWHGVITGIVASLVIGIAFKLFSFEFEGEAEEIFEGVTMLVTAAMLSSFIIYMIRVKPSVKQIESETGEKLGNKWGLFFLVAISILREGIESVLFLVGLNVNGIEGLIGSLLGLLVGIGLVYLLFKGFVRLNFKVLFGTTNALLMLIAAGLVAHGIHELQEAGVINVLSQTAWDINPAITAEGEYPLLHEKGAIGSIMVSLFGYNGNPSVLEIVCYVAYLLTVGSAAYLGGARKSSGEKAA